MALAKDRIFKKKAFSLLAVFDSKLLYDHPFNPWKIEFAYLFHRRISFFAIIFNISAQNLTFDLVLVSENKRALMLSEIL